MEGVWRDHHKNLKTSESGEIAKVKASIVRKDKLIQSIQK